MASSELLSPVEMLEINVEKFTVKANRTLKDVLILGFLSGVFIALAGVGASIVSHNLLLNYDTYGIGKFLTGVIFPVGLICVFFLGLDLFTSNCLIFASFLAEQVSFLKMAKNWTLVFFSNFVGGVFVATLFYLSAQMHYSGNQLGGYIIKLAYSKMTMTPVEAISSAILCNIIVCACIWFANGMAKSSAKFMAVFFPIFLFAAAGFEHCVANMFYLTSGILATGNEAYVMASGLGVEQLSQISFQNALMTNLLPVTMGNIIGGTIFIAGLFFILYGKKARLSKNNSK